MNEPLWETLLSLANVLHWLKKYEECNAITVLAIKLREYNIRTQEQLINWLERIKL